MVCYNFSRYYYLYIIDFQIIMIFVKKTAKHNKSGV